MSRVPVHPPPGAAGLEERRERRQVIPADLPVDELHLVEPSRISAAHLVDGVGVAEVAGRRLQGSRPRRDRIALTSNALDRERTIEIAANYWCEIAGACDPLVANSIVSSAMLDEESGCQRRHLGRRLFLSRWMKTIKLRTSTGPTARPLLLRAATSHQRAKALACKQGSTCGKGGSEGTCSLAASRA